MDAIRLRQIDEVLGYDKKINTMVFGIEKKRVARYPDERPESQYDADAETTTKDNINALRVLLDNKYANISIMQRPGISIISDQFSNASKEVFQVETVVQSYNTAVAPLASNQNMMFRQTTSNHMRELLNTLGPLIKGLTSLANLLAERIDGAGTTTHLYLCEVRRIASRFRPERPLHQNKQVDTDPERGCRGARVGSDQQ